MRRPGRVSSAREVRALAERLARSEERLKVVQAVADLGIWELDIATGQVLTTPEMKALFGMTGGTGFERDTPYVARIHPDDRGDVLRLRERALRSRRSASTEFRVVLPGGELRWMALRAVYLRTRGRHAARMMGVCADITERRRAEAGLAANAERLRIALKAEGLVAFHQDRDLRYTWVANPALGAAESDVVGRTDREILGAAASRELVAIKRRVLRTAKGTRQDVRVRRGDHEGWFDLVVEPSRDCAGRVNGVICRAIDITERRQGQQALEDSRRRLSDLVEHQRDLLEAERAAVARDVHDHVGATLTGVRLKLAALAARTPDAGTREALRGIAASVDRAHAVTRRICAHLTPVELEDLGLAESCRGYALEWGATAGIRAQCRFVALRREPATAVATDMFRALQELLTNVARHARAKNVRIALGERGGRLVLRVADDGRGLPRRARAKGFGLEGLRERVARHGGKLDMDSSARGVDARVEIPLRRRA